MKDKKNKKRERLNWDQLEANYNDFIKRQSQKSISKNSFEKVIKKAVTIKQSSVK